MRLSRFQVLDGFMLKWIAIVSMVIDHAGAILLDGVLAPYETDGYIYFTSDMPWFVRNVPTMKSICEALGSVAFPIFCFLLVEGFVHTRNRVRYGLRMGLFALISEIPFDLAHYGKPFCGNLQNVMFTLCIGIFTLYCIDLAHQEFAGQKALFIALAAAITLAGAGLALLIRSEYVFLGIATIVLLYALRGNRNWQLAGFAPLLVASPWILLSLPPVRMYNGQRGRGLQYFFYVFYPAHLLLFYGIARLLAQR